MKRALVAAMLLSMLTVAASSLLAGCSGKANPKDAPPIATSGVQEGKMPTPGGENEAGE